MDEVNSLEKFDSIRRNPDNAGKTFKVCKEVFDHYHAQLEQRVRHITAEEANSISQLIGVDPGPGAGTTRDATCSNCEHTFDLSDHVASALLTAVHKPLELREFFEGQNYWLTIDTDKQREAICPHCYHRGVIIHCCYTFSKYAYA